MRQYSMTIGCWNWVKGERDLTTFHSAKIVAASTGKGIEEAKALLALPEEMDIWTPIEVIELSPEEAHEWTTWHNVTATAREVIDLDAVADAERV